MDFDINEIPCLKPFIKDGVQTIDGDSALFLLEKHWIDINKDEMSEPEMQVFEEIVEVFGFGIFNPSE